MPSKRWLKKVAYLNSRPNTSRGRRFFQRYPELLQEGKMGFGKKYIDKGNKYIDNPDTFGIRELPPLVQEVIRVHDEVQQTTPPRSEAIENMPYVSFPKGDHPVSLRHLIACHIRQLTYRELKQIADEITKCDPASDIRQIPADIMAQTLDDWAHMIKDEDEQG